MRKMFYLFTLLWLFSFGGLLTLQFRRRFETVMLPGLCSAVFVLYLFSFADQLRAGFWLLVFLAAFFWILLLISFLKKDPSVQEFRKNYFTPGALVFLLAVLWFFLLYRNQGFANCDEFMHWGPMVLQTLRNNGFYLTGDILRVHNDYPPFITLLRVLFCGFNGFVYREPILYIAQSVFYISCFLPLMKKLEFSGKEDLLKSLFVLLSVLLGGLWISKTVTAQEWALLYSSIYADWPLAALAGAALCYVHTEKNDAFFIASLTLILSAILLTKQIGICFYMLIVFYAVVRTALEKDRKAFIRLIPAVFLPLLAFLSWSLLLKIREIGGQFVVGNMSFSEAIRESLVGGSYANGIARHYLRELLFRPMTTHPLPLPYFPVALLLAAVMLVCYRKNGILLAFTYLMGSAAYAFTILLLYMTSFGSDEAVVLASFDRYMITYLFFGVILLLCCIISFFLEKDSRLLYLLPLVLLLFIETASLNTLLPKAKLQQNTLRVLLIDPFDDFRSDREELSGLKFEYIESGLNKRSDPDVFLSELGENDLVYIQNYDDDFYFNCWPRQNYENEPYNQTLYSIGKEENGFRLEPLYYSFYDYVNLYYQIPKK